MDQSATALPPPTVPGLTGLSVMARGGYATVYRAVQESVGRDVAVKVENRALENERDQRRFLREDLAAGRKTEVDYLNGEIVRLAERLGRRAPVNARLTALVHDAEAEGARRRWTADDLLRELATAAGR